MTTTPPGLVNETNTCFLSASLQGLAACPPAVWYALAVTGAALQVAGSGLPSSNTDWVNAGLALGYGLAELLTSLNEVGLGPLRSSSFLANAGLHTLVDGSQGDAREALFDRLWAALGVVATTCQSASAHVPSALRAAALPAAPSGTRPARALRRAVVLRTRHGASNTAAAASAAARPASQLHAAAAAAAASAADLSDPLQGLLMRRTQCATCGAADPWHPELFTCLTIVMPPGPSVSLAQAIGHTLAPERIPDWICAKCGGSGCVRQAKLSRWPQVLALHVQRATAWGVDTRFLSFPHDFTAAASSTRYALHAVVEHYGMSGAGHYIAYRRAPSRLSDAAHAAQADTVPSTASAWVRANDAVMTPVAWPEVCKAKAYLLLYVADSAPVPRSMTRRASDGSAACTWRGHTPGLRPCFRVPVPGAVIWRALQHEAEAALRVPGVAELPAEHGEHEHELAPSGKKHTVDLPTWSAVLTGSRGQAAHYPASDR